MYFSLLFILSITVLLTFAAPSDYSKLKEQLNYVSKQLSRVELQLNNSVNQLLKKMDQNNHELTQLIKSMRVSQTDGEDSISNFKTQSFNSCWNPLLIFFRQ